MPKTETEATPSYTRVELGGPLDGHHVLVDADAITMGAIEDLQSNQMGKVFDVLCDCIVDTDLVSKFSSEGKADRAIFRECFRGMKKAEFGQVVNALVVAMSAVPNAS